MRAMHTAPGDVAEFTLKAIVVGIVLSVLLGMLLEWALISHLYKRDHLEQVLLTYGLILVFEELRSLIVGNDVHGVAVPAGEPARMPQ